MATMAPEGMSQWLDLLAELRAEIDKIEANVSQASEVHRQNSFDALIQLNPDTMEKDQLCYLWHFAEKGYFTVEREIMVTILEDRKKRWQSGPSTAVNIADRASLLAEKYESRLHELHVALELYAKSQEGKFYIPASLSEEEIGVLRGMVKEKLETIKTKIAELDLKIDELQRK